MSNFELQYTELGGLRSRFQRVGGELADCSSRLRKQVNALNRQYGFGIDTVRREISGLSERVKDVPSNDCYKIAGFLYELNHIVQRSENDAYRVLAQTVPQALKLTDAVVPFTPFQPADADQDGPWWKDLWEKFLSPAVGYLSKVLDFLAPIVPGWVGKLIQTGTGIVTGIWSSFLDNAADGAENLWRFVGESLGEGGIDLAIDALVGFGVGTGVVAVLGLSGAPVVLGAAALAYGLVWSFNDGWKKITGEDFSEWAYDRAADIGQWVADTAKDVADAIGDTFNDAVNCVKNVVDDLIPDWVPFIG